MALCEDKRLNSPQSATEPPPLIHLFQSNGYKFFLDLHTNRLFSLEPRDAEVMERWLKGATLSNLSQEYPKEVAEIKKLQKAGLFCNNYPEALAFGIDWQRIQHKILHERQRTLIEITQHCNLRCKYCTFGGGFKDHRTHSSATMSEELLEKTISSALAHGDELEEIAIGFYGGEPLLAFDLIKKGVLLAQRISSGKRIRFSITTNATLIDKSKARFLRDANFSILVSLDGPQTMHDFYRIFPSGKGSYVETIKGLKILLECYSSDLESKIGLNMVVPSSAWIPYLEELWDRETWLPRTLRAQATPANPPAGLFLPKAPSGATIKMLEKDWFLNIAKKEPGKTTLGREVFDIALAKLHHRPRFSGYRRTFFPNGCCIPGSHKVYVCVDGAYQVCERVHGLPSIGSVTQGIDLSKIKEIIEEYTENSFQDCRYCWAISICRLCFQHAYEDEKFNLQKKQKSCANIKKSINANLQMYGFIGIKYPHKLEEWDAVEIK